MPNENDDQLSPLPVSQLSSSPLDLPLYNPGEETTGNTVEEVVSNFEKVATKVGSKVETALNTVGNAVSNLVNPKEENPPLTEEEKQKLQKAKEKQALMTKTNQEWDAYFGVGGDFDKIKDQFEKAAGDGYLGPKIHAFAKKLDKLVPPLGLDVKALKEGREEEAKLLKEQYKRNLQSYEEKAAIARKKGIVENSSEWRRLVGEKPKDIGANIDAVIEAEKTWPAREKAYKLRKAVAKEQKLISGSKEWLNFVGPAPKKYETESVVEGQRIRQDIEGASEALENIGAEPLSYDEAARKIGLGILVEGEEDPFDGLESSIESLDTKEFLDVTINAGPIKKITKAQSEGTQTIITIPKHNYKVGNKITFKSFTGGMTELNDKAYTITSVRNADTFSISFNSSRSRPFVSGSAFRPDKDVLDQLKKNSERIEDALNRKIAAFEDNVKIILRNLKDEIIGFLNENMVWVKNFVLQQLPKYPLDLQKLGALVAMYKIYKDIKALKKLYDVIFNRIKEYLLFVVNIAEATVRKFNLILDGVDTAVNKIPEAASRNVKIYGDEIKNTIENAKGIAKARSNYQKELIGSLKEFAGEIVKASMPIP